MGKIVTKSTELAHWHALVKEAQQSYGRNVAVELESYLVFLLQRFTCSPHIAGSVLAMDYLESHQTTGHMRDQKLREVGDKCLLFSGIFPERAAQSRVSVSYYVDLGRKSYQSLARIPNRSQSQANLYNDLEQKFVSLMDLLHCIREMGEESKSLSFAIAEELWQRVGSLHARRVLQRYKDQLHIKVDPDDEILLN